MKNLFNDKKYSFIPEMAKELYTNILTTIYNPVEIETGSVKGLQVGNLTKLPLSATRFRLSRWRKKC